MLATAILPVYGIPGPGVEEAATDAGKAVDKAAAGTGEGGGDFGLLVSLYQSNAYLLSELKTVRVKLARAREYLATAGSNPTLGGAQVQRLRARHSAALALLRANRHQARGLLARVGGAPGRG